MSNISRIYTVKDGRVYTEDGWEVEYRTVKKVRKMDSGALDVNTYDDNRYFGNGFVIPAERVKGELKPNDSIEIFVGGNCIRGYKVNWTEWYYQTKEQAEEERLQWFKDEETRRQKEFDENIDEWQKSMISLEPVFYNRLKAFEERYGFIEFWRDKGGPYELFIYEEAQKLIQRAKKAFPHSPVFQIGWLREYKNLSYDEQKAFAPDLSHDEHSGNTFSCAIGFASAYLEGKL